MLKTDLIIDRLKKELGIIRDKELSEKLGVSHQVVSAWKTRNTVNIELIIEKYPQIDLNYVLKGERSAAASTVDGKLFTELERLREDNKRLVELLKKSDINSEESKRILAIIESQTSIADTEIADLRKENSLLKELILSALKKT